MNSVSRHAAPVFIDESGARTLQRRLLGPGLDDRKQREEFIESLVHNHPDIIPMADIEPTFTPLRPSAVNFRPKLAMWTICGSRRMAESSLANASSFVIRKLGGRWLLKPWITRARSQDGIMGTLRLPLARGSHRVL